MENALKKELINYLTTFISEKRKMRFEEVLFHRTDHLKCLSRP
jgi:hypothetical protein